jgi:hypothetical protein
MGHDAVWFDTGIDISEKLIASIFTVKTKLQVPPRIHGSTSQKVEIITGYRCENIRSKNYKSYSVHKRIVAK